MADFTLICPYHLSSKSPQGTNFHFQQALGLLTLATKISIYLPYPSVREQWKYKKYHNVLLHENHSEVNLLVVTITVNCHVTTSTCDTNPLRQISTHHSALLLLPALGLASLELGVGDPSLSIKLGGRPRVGMLLSRNGVFGPGDDDLLKTSL